MKMKSGMATSTSLVITPKTRCGSAPRSADAHGARDVAEQREAERHAAERQRHRIAGEQQPADREDHQDGEDFRHHAAVSTIRSPAAGRARNTAAARMACASPCSASSSAKSGISVFSRNTAGMPLVSRERSRMAHERAT